MKIETKQITDYICGICETRHSNSFDAEKCESLGFPKEEPKKIGDNLEYQEENQLLVYWSYSGATGQILQIKILPNIDKTDHLYVYRVQSKYGGIRWALPNKDGGGYSSPVEWIE